MNTNEVWIQKDVDCCQLCLVFYNIYRGNDYENSSSRVSPHSWIPKRQKLQYSYGV